MKLTTKSEYACLAIIDLAKYFDKKFIKTKDIAKRNKIPKKYLEQILMVLHRQGYVKSKRGVYGGYQLAKPPNRISVAEIVRLMDGAIAPVESVSKYFHNHTVIEQNKPLLKLFKEIRDYTAKRLESISFKDLTN